MGRPFLPRTQLPTLAATLLPLLPGAVAARAGAQDPADDPSLAFFEERIRPLIEERCLDCHAADERSSGLALDSRAGLLLGGSRGPAIVPGDPEASLLLRAVRRVDPDLEMPPDDPLDAEAVAALARWIADGARWTGAAPGEAEARWWSYRPVTDPEPPALAAEAAAASEIDRFVLARLAAAGLSPVGEADRITLLRRVTLDLTGLPPTPDEIAAYLWDGSPTAFEKVVDRLLASPRYGERWGRHWLDLARYADTAGDSSDYPIQDAWRYRNWVLDAFNADMPYDAFLREQIAGDVVAAAEPGERYAERTVATGFLALARRFGVGKEQDRHLIIGDVIDTLGRTVLGTTLACARCHDHKFDPLTTADYYGLYGIFDSTRFPFPGSENERKPDRLVPLAPPAEIAQAEAFHAFVLLELDRRHAEVQQEIARTEEALAASQEDTPTRAAARAKLDWLTVERGRLADERARRGEDPPRFPTAYAVAEAANPHDARVQPAGNPQRKGGPVARGFPAVMRGDDPAPIGEGGSGRLALADWLTDPGHPLTARVLVNRVWQHHFGRGIVATPSDFGRQGSPPSHPELLDWLASRFVADGWSIKGLHRRILLSDAYRRSSAWDGAAGAVDPEDTLLWRFPRRRLDAEELRDSLLFLGGRLDESPGGAHPFPPLKKWNWTQHRPFRAVYPSERRTVYLMTQRIKRHPYLALFDGPDTNASCARRMETTTPSQALFLMNSGFVHEQAGSFAHRILELDEDRRLDAAWRLVYGRPPAADEHDEVAAWLVDERNELALSGTGAEGVELAAWTGLARVLFASNEFLYVD